MSKVKCIVRQDWETRSAAGDLIERKSAVYVTNEDGTPHVYDSISDARAEIRSNYGRDANRAGMLYNHSVDEISGNVHDGYVIIIREDSTEYAESINRTMAERITEAVAEAEHAADAAEQAAAEAIAARDNGDKSAAAKASNEAATFADRATAASLDVYHLSGNTCDTPESKAAGDAAHRASIASSEAIRAFYDTKETEHAAVKRLVPAAVEEYGNTEDATNAAAYGAFTAIYYRMPKTDADYSNLDRLMGYAAEEVAKYANLTANEAANATITDANKALTEIESENDRWAQWAALYIMTAEESAAKAADLAALADDETVKAKCSAVGKMVKRVREDVEAAMPEYEPAELYSLLGDYVDAYDVDAIESEATKAGRWTPEAVRDLMSICERHELKD